MFPASPAFVPHHRPLPKAVIAVLATLAMLATLLVGSAPPAFAANSFTLTPTNPSNDTTPLFQWASDSGSTSFECRVDSADELDFVPCDPTDPGYEVTPALTETPDPHTFDVRGNDGAGGWLAPDTYSWTVDLTPPTFTGFTGPDVLTNETTANINFTSDDPDATTTCSIDGVAIDPCSPPIELTGLAEGEHSFLFQFTDLAGNADVVRGHTWTIDTTPPVTTITGSPADGDVTSSSAVSFAFSTEGGAETTCGIVGSSSGVLTPSTAPCESINTTTASDDVYTLTVSSTDAAGNVESAQTRTWTYDTTPPETTIDTKPDALTTNPDATFTFSSNETGVTYVCTLDGAGAACTSPKSYAALADGDYTFTVTATDAAGNPDATPASWDWTVDTTAPVTSLDSGPKGTVASDAATIEFSSTDPGATFMCRLDNDAAGFAACESPQNLTGLSEGSHTFEVKAADVAGNVEDPPVSVTWTVDTTAAETVIDSGPVANTNESNATISFSTPDTEATFECSLDGADFGPCPTVAAATQQAQTARLVYGTSGSATYTGLTDGPHTFDVRASDSVGNTDQTPARHEWNIDTVEPDTFITSGPSGVQNSRTATISFEADEEGVTFECYLDGGSWWACTSPTVVDGLADGSHTFKVRATDAAGNVEANPASVTWTVDATEPGTLITSGPSGIVTTRSASFAFAGSDGAVSFECKLDSGPWTACTSPNNLTVADGAHTFSVRALDGAGNRDSTPDTRTWTVDTVGPTLSIDSGPSGFVTTGDASFAWSSTEALAGDECRLDGGAWTACNPSPKSYTGLADGTHLFEVRAKDVNGNTGPSASQSWTIDRVAPNTILTSRPSNGTLTTARITFTATETATFACSLDNAAFAACTSPTNLSGLSVGTHTFRVKATDLAGQTDATPAVTSWSVSAPTASQRFTDVKDSDLFAADIARLAESGVTKGCNKDGTRFCPDLNVTRGEMAAFFTRALNLPAGTKVFSDTRGHLFQANIAALERAGITRGCNNARTKFCPDDFVTRGEMAAFFTRALDLPAGTKVFSDTQGHLFQANIAALERAGITKGCNNARTKFCPDQFITRGQMAAFFARSGVLNS